MQPADEIVTPATERIHVAAPLARIPKFNRFGKAMRGAVSAGYSRASSRSAGRPLHFPD
jgi:hypothetical protein